MAELRKSTLSKRDYENMDAFLRHALEDYKAGTITKDEAVDGLAHVMAALDKGNYDEAVSWIEQGRKLIRSHR